MTARSQLRPNLPPLPERMRELPIDDRGYPIPEFVSHLDGKRDFRAVSLEHLANCIRLDVCWICGQLLEAAKVFVIGPLPAIQAISNEPPSHAECAEFAAKACPFLLSPRAKHRTMNNPQVHKMRGAMKGNNPGVCCLYTVRGYAYSENPKGIIFRTGRALRVDWYTEGRLAARAEVLAAINASLRAVRRPPGDRETIDRRIAELLPD
jgi:hypothetical protein